MAVHVWRTFFSVRKNNAYDGLSRVQQGQYEACERVYVTRFEQSDRIILETYYTSKWGDDRYVVEDYSARTGTSTGYIWQIVKLANRYVAEEIGILDRRESGK